MSRTAGPGAPVVTRDQLVRAGVVGALAGLLSGLFGVGGGILMVPGLVMVAGMEQRLAHGTSLAAIVPIAVAGVLGYVAEGSIDVPAAAGLAAGSMVGAVIGTRALHVLPQRALRLAFAALLVATAARMLLGSGDASGRGDFTVGIAAALVAVGLVAGILSGLLGVGGGVVLVPAMILLLGIPDAVAKATSLLVILPTAVVGTSRNVARGNAHVPAAAALGLSGVVTALVGVRLSTGLSDDASSALFAGLLLVVAARIVFGDVRDRRERSAAAVDGGVGAGDPPT